MAITQFIVVPSRATGQDTFSADAEVFWGQLPTFVTEVNSFITSLNGSWTSSSVTSLLVGTGSKTLTVGTGLGFQVGMPIRLANTDSIYMTGDVTSYNSVTGELVCNITSFTGSGTYASWSVYAIPASVGASLVANKFTGLQTFADEVAVASASTINLTTADSNNVEITGTTTITAVTMPEGAVIKARASGAFQLTNSSSLIVQGNANYTTTVNDILTFTKDGAGNVHVEISKENGQSVSFVFATEAEYQAGTDTTKSLNPFVARAQNLVLRTPIATTSGTSHDFTSIPSWVKRITMTLDVVSTNGTSNLLIQIGDAGGIENTGYVSTVVVSNSVATSTSGFLCTFSIAAATPRIGVVVLSKAGTDKWCISGIVAATDTSVSASLPAGTKTLSATLDRIRLTTVAGTDTFDAGSINIIYE